MAMAAHKQVEIGGRLVEVRELKVGDIRQWFAQLAGGERNMVDAMLIDGQPLDDLRLMTNLTPEQMDEMRPSEIRELADVCQEVNADFFEMRGRIEEVGKRVIERRAQQQP